jgi:signal transduction histidine kinase
LTKFWPNHLLCSLGSGLRHATEVYRRSCGARRRWRIGIFVLLVLFACRSGTAGDFLTEVWTAEQGLPDSSVTALAQTPDGYLWIGTYNGLARFDGTHFTVFDPENTPALGHARVRRLFVDGQGALWINTFDGSLTRLQGGRFEREWTAANADDRDVLMAAADADSITFVLERGEYQRKELVAPAGTGWKPLVLPNRNLRVLPLAAGECLTWFNGASIRMWRLRAQQFSLVAESSALLGQRIRTATGGESGRVWLGTDRQIALWDGAAIRGMTPTNGEPELEVNLLVGSEGDEAFWGLANGRVRRAEAGRWVAEAEALRDVFAEDSARRGGLSDGNGGVWLYDFGHGLIHVSPEGKVWRYAGAARFPGERITCLIRDREGTVWAGFQQGGLLRVVPRRFIAPAGLADEASSAARCVTEDAAGRMWFGLLGGGLRRLEEARLVDLTVPGDLPRGSVFSAWPGSHGRLWLSAGAEDLHYLDAEQTLVRVNPVIHSVKTILEDSRKRLWVGTRHGLMMARPAQSPEFEIVEGMESVVVRTVVEDRQGRIWAGGDTGTLYCITDGGVEAFRPEDAFGGHAIWSLWADADGTLWVGTFRGGLLRFREGRFFRFSKAQGLVDNVVAQILADEQGYLWLGTHRGVLRVARTELTAVAAAEKSTLAVNLFGRSDGLPSLECSGGYQPAAWRSRDGRLWFTTLRGIVSVQPETLRLNPLPPRLHIEEVLVDGKVVWSPLAQSAGGRDAKVGNTTTAEADRKAAPLLGPAKVTLEIPPGRKPVEIRYAALSLSAPERVEYQHRLVGEEAHWVAAGPRRFAHYSALGPGDYQFQLQACNGDGIWSAEVAALTLRILPHVHETWWFRGGAILLGVGILLGIGRQRLTTKFRRQAEALERRTAIERERARIAKDIHDDLGSSLTLIAVMGDLARQDSGGDRVEKISLTARRAVRSLDEIVWAVNPRNDQIVHLMDYISGYALDYLSAAQIRCRLEIPEQVAPQELSSKVRYNIFLTVKEALQNIVKHARATEVSLTASITAKKLKLVIADNGGGFAVTPQNSQADGLRNMQQRMLDIGGSCDIQTAVGSGTTVVLELQWATPH